MPTKGGITPDQRVKLDRLSRSNHLSPQGKKRVTEIMNDSNTTQEDADLRIKEINEIIKERKSKEK